MFLMFQFFLFVPWLAEFYYNLIQQQGCSLCQDENAIYQPVLICDICANHLIKVKSGHKSSTSRSSHWRRENLWWRMVLRWLHDWPSTHTGMHVLLGFAQKLLRNLDFLIYLISSRKLQQQSYIITRTIRRSAVVSVTCTFSTFYSWHDHFTSTFLAWVRSVRSLFINMYIYIYSLGHHFPW